MARARIANAATRVTRRSSLSHAGRERTEQPAVVEWNAKRRRLILRVFNTRTVDRQEHEATAPAGPTPPPPLYATESPPYSPDHDVQVGPGHNIRYQQRTDTHYGNGESVFQLRGLSVKESNYNRFETGRTVARGEYNNKRDRVEKPGFTKVVGNTITNRGEGLDHDSRQRADVGNLPRVIESWPNYQSNELETAEIKKSVPQRLVHDRQLGRVLDTSSFLWNPETVNIRLYPTYLNRIHESKGSVGYLLEDERLQRKRGVLRDPSFLGSIILDPLDHKTNVGISLGPVHPPRTNQVLKHRPTGRRKTMNKFPSKRPSTPENLKALSAKHCLKTLRENEAEAEPRRHPHTSNGRRRDWSPSETIVIEEDTGEEEDCRDTGTGTASTGSNSTVYLIRTVKKPKSNGRAYTKKAEPISNETEEPYPRKAILEPVTLRDNPGDKDRGQRARPTKTKRVKNSVTQTSEDTLQDDRPGMAAAAETAPAIRFITPRRQKRSIGLQTVIEEGLPNPDSTSSRKIRPSKTTIAIQTDIPKTSMHTKTTVATQTMGKQTDSKSTSGGKITREQKEKHDFCGQTEKLLTETTTDHQSSEDEISNRIPPLRQDQEGPDVSWPTATIQPRLQLHDTLNTQHEENPPRRNVEAQAAAANGMPDDQNKLVDGLHHEVRLLRHENYYLRQQLDYPIKPKGRLQKQNEEKILQVIRQLESQGPTGKLTLQIREEMMHEAMIENEILRSENSDLQTTLDQSRRLQETLSTENEQLRQEIQLHQRKMALQDVDPGHHRQVDPDDDFHHRQIFESDDIDASRSYALGASTLYNKGLKGVAESVTMTTMAAPRTRTATKQTLISKLSAEGEQEKPEFGH